MSKAAELAALIGSGQAQGNKNLIINGAMNVAQRGTTSSITSGTGNFGPDRFRFQINDLGTWELSQSTTVPSGQGFSNSLKLNCTTADTSVAAASYLVLQQRIEGQNLQQLKWGTSSAEKLTWSFWIRSTKTGTISIEFQHKNSSSAYYNRGSTFTIDSSNTWEKKTISVPANTAQNIINDNSDGLYVTFWLTAGSNWTGGTFNTSAYVTGGAANTRVSSSIVNHADSTSNEIYLTGVQLEIGDVATAFEHEDIGTTLAKCQRYYFQYGPHPSVATFRHFNPAYANDCYCSAVQSFPVEMRAVPTVAYSAITYQNADNWGTSSGERNQILTYSMSTSATVISGAYIAGNGTDYAYANAEL